MKNKKFEFGRSTLEIDLGEDVIWVDVDNGVLDASIRLTQEEFDEVMKYLQTQWINSKVTKDEE